MDFTLLSKYRINCPKSELAKSADSASEAAGKIGFPVAMKIVSPEVLHKTDMGGVRLDIRDKSEAKAAYNVLMARFAGNKTEGVLVQQMAGKGAVELIVGGKKDPQFGQMIMVGMGGIFVEVFRDFSLRVCPITESDAYEMLSELKAAPILEGARGRKPVDRKALVQTLLRVSRLLVDEDPMEFDLNPLMADDKGCIAVDMRIIK